MQLQVPRAAYPASGAPSVRRFGMTRPIDFDSPPWLVVLVAEHGVGDQAAVVVVGGVVQAGFDDAAA
jgi:hypothetical protein